MRSEQAGSVINPLTPTFVAGWRERLTSYERARIVSARALQLAMGAAPLIDVVSSGLVNSSSIRIAEEELKARLLPISVRRRFPNGKTELVSAMNAQ